MRLAVSISHAKQHLKGVNVGKNSKDTEGRTLHFYVMCSGLDRFVSVIKRGGKGQL